MIRFVDVSARYVGAHQLTLFDVSLVVTPGTLTAVVGPNGSGKSTLIRTLLGRVEVAGGRVMIDAQDLAHLTRREVARRVAVVVQREEPVFAMPVREYVALGRYPHASAWSVSHDDDAIIERTSEVAGISSLLTRQTDTLSGGEWQRVRIARALSQEANAIVLDEPTTFLDIAHEMEAFELLATLAAAGRSILVVSHQLNLVARFAQHVVLLHHGRVAAAGTPDEVMQARTLEAIYEWPLVVVRDPVVGAPILFPLRSRRT